MCLVSIAARLAVIIFPGSYTAMLIGGVMFSFATSFLETVAEGASAIITKNRERIKYIERAEKAINNEEINPDQQEEESMKAFGFFSNIRALTSTVMSFAGGLASTRIKNIQYSYSVLVAYPIYLFFLILFSFKEEKVLFA